MSVAVMNCRDQSHLWKEESLWLWLQRESSSWQGRHGGRGRKQRVHILNPRSEAESELKVCEAFST